MKNYPVKYKGQWLHKNSQAYDLYKLAQTDPDYQKRLDQHMKQLEQNYKQLHYGKPTVSD